VTRLSRVVLFGVGGGGGGGVGGWVGFGLAWFFWGLGAYEGEETHVTQAQNGGGGTAPLSLNKVCLQSFAARRGKKRLEEAEGGERLNLPKKTTFSPEGKKKSHRGKR